jgi:protein ImuB
MLWLCLHLPTLALDIHTRGAPSSEPLVVADGQGRAQYIAAANAAAQRLGVQPGVSVSAAQALTDALRIKPRALAAEQESLARLAAWCGQYTPSVSIAAADALLLEVEGSRQLFAGLEPLVQRVRQGLTDLGYTVRLAVAPTPLGATWLARAGNETLLTDHGALFGALAELPLTCLSLDAKRETLLTALGLRTLVDCLRLPRDGIARRVGVEVLDALDRAFGRLPDPRPAYVAPARFQARLELPAPVDSRQALSFPLHRLLLELAGFLEARGVGASALEFELHSLKAQCRQVSLQLVTPSRDAAHLSVLVRERLERLNLAAPVEAVTLVVNAVQPLGAQSLDFFERAQSPNELRVQLVERLQARLGRAAVHGVATRSDHRPERAWRYVAPGTVEKAAAFGRRPVWLLPEPVALEQRAGNLYWGDALLLEPERERIEGGWWDGQEVARDYFIARDRQGREFWVFRDLTEAQSWYVHGVFG